MGGMGSCLSLFSPVRLFDPVWCRNSRCTITSAAMTNCIRKCSVKNRVSVALSIANPPQTHCTRSGLVKHTKTSRQLLMPLPIHTN
jgi:hypothetical protein